MIDSCIGAAEIAARYTILCAGGKQSPGIKKTAQAAGLGGGIGAAI